MAGRIFERIADVRQKFIGRRKNISAQYHLPNKFVTALGMLNLYRRLQKMFDFRN